MMIYQKFWNVILNIPSYLKICTLHDKSHIALISRFHPFIRTIVSEIIFLRHIVCFFWPSGSKLV